MVLSGTLTATAATPPSTLSLDQALHAGQRLASVGGQYALIMQTDGNLVEYGNGCVQWASGTVGSGGNDTLLMQDDGNLVLYGSHGPAWASGTVGSGAVSLNLQDDGNLVLYAGGNKAVWATGAPNANQLCAPDSMGLDQYLHSPNGQYKLLMQDDGNLVTYGPGGPVWSSGTVGTGGVSVNMQDDGNFVMYTSAAKPVWSTGTAGAGGGSHLVLQNDGNLVLNSGNGTTVWQSATAKAATGKTLSYNEGVAGNCTWWAINQFHAFSGLYPNFSSPANNGNAQYWATNAANDGWTVISSARVNSIAVFPPGVNGAGSAGHVAWVTGVSGGRITVSEMNFNANGGGFNKTDTRTLTPANSVRYIVAP